MSFIDYTLLVHFFYLPSIENYMIKKYIIIGDLTVGIGATQKLRQLDQESAIIGKLKCSIINVLLRF